ncbi:MAG: DNA polymerase III subunit beta [Clostridiales bacterium]|nr:DNA polymerase III subunit beta [Clostridiales bacterium]
MKFTCRQQSLSKALNTVSKAVTSRTTIPILKGILLSATKDGSLVLTASDLDISIEKTLVGVDVEEEGQAVVQAKLFTEIVRKLPEGDVLIEQKEDNSILIKASISEFTIAGLPAEEFPEPGEIVEEEQIVLEKELFQEMIRKTSFSASIDESKGVLVGVLIELTEKNTSMVALDGFRMAVVREEMKNAKSEKLIISAKILNDINKILSDVEEEAAVTIGISKKKAALSMKNLKVSLRLLEGEFIKYKEVLPRESKCRLVVNKMLFHESMERAALLSREGKNNLVKLIVYENLLTITSRSEEGNVKEEVAVEKDGINLEIGFNSKYVIDILKAIDEETIAIELVSSVKPCVIKPVSGARFEYLVLPVRIY